MTLFPRRSGVEASSLLCHSHSCGSSSLLRCSWTSIGVCDCTSKSQQLIPCLSGSYVSRAKSQDLSLSIFAGSDGIGTGPTLVPELVADAVSDNVGVEGFLLDGLDGGILRLEGELGC
jgi:hypothetical protein